MYIDLVVEILELIGTVAFALSGVMVAKSRHMDIFGAIVLGCITAVGGGAIRDILLGNTPPQMFTNPTYVFLAAITSIVTFWVIYKPHVYLEKHKTQTNMLLNVTDSLGLAIFVVVGCQTAIQSGYGENIFLCTFVGTLSGIGGGILRDMLAGQIPLIFKERVYGVAAISGAIIYMYALQFGATYFAIILSVISTLCIRFLAIHYRWHLPRLN